MNKYQIKLDYIKNISDDYDDVGRPMYPYKYNASYKDCVDTLQELIDKYSKPSCEHHCETVDMLREQFMAYEQKCGKLEKALELACELIDTKYDCPFEEYEYQFKDKRNCYICDNKSKDCWKEYLLKESEKDNA